MSLNEAQGFTFAPYGPVCDKRGRLSAKQAQYVKKDPVWDAQRSYIAKETHHVFLYRKRDPSWHKETQYITAHAELGITAGAVGRVPPR